MQQIIYLFYITFIEEQRYQFFLNGLGTTLILTLGSFILGTVLGVGLCACKLSKQKTVAKIASAIISFFVQLPTLVLLMIFVYIIFGSSGMSVLIVAIFALTIKSASYMADIFYTAINTVAKGEIEAARTLGMTSFQAFRYVVFPQTVKAAMPIYKNQFIITMQETSIVGYLALMDLTRASSVVTSRTLDAFFGLITISIIYILLGYVGQYFIGLFENKKHIGGETK